MLGYTFRKFKIKYIVLIIGLITTSFCIIQFVTLFFSEKYEGELPTIIWWTPFMWEKKKIITCANKYRCLMTKHRKYINNTNLQALLFYGSRFKLNDLPKRKNTNWALYHEESPRNEAIFLHQQTFNLFDITSTFSRESDFPVTLQYLENLSLITDSRYVIKVEEKNKLLKNISPVLYVQSDCDTPVDRDVYVGELMKYIEVDSYGACLNNKKFPPKIAKVHALDLYNVKILRFIAQYKFVISFENGICEDYITEKLWRPLVAGAVPIYLGSPSIEDWLPNKNSAVLAKNFTPEDLANYIKKINSNDSLYESFLEHKRGKVENELLKSTLANGPFGLKTDREHPIQAFECFVCQRIHEGIVKKSLKPVYDCAKPKSRSWEYFWKSGDCKSKMLVDFVKNNRKIKADLC